MVNWVLNWNAPASAALQALVDEVVDPDYLPVGDLAALKVAGLSFLTITDNLGALQFVMIYQIVQRLGAGKDLIIVGINGLHSKGVNWTKTMWPIVEEHAVANGIDRLRFTVERAGMASLVNELGAVHVTSLFEKRLGAGVKQAMSFSDKAALV